MHEIITVQVGQAGNCIGERFWKLACEEHGIDSCGSYHGESDLQLERINVYFNEIRNQRYVPRSVFVDLDQMSINKIRNSTYKNLFNPELLINGKMSASNNFAKGFFTEGAEILPELMDTIRRVAEECDLVHGFQFLHSISGGAGGGLGSLLIDNIRQEYLDRIIKTYSIFPALSMSHVVVEPYNAVLTMNHLIENTDETFCFDNITLFDILNKTLRLPQGSYTDINHILAQVMIGITACFRFPGQLNMDLRKLAVNMIPFPALHFLTTSFSPLQARHIARHTNINELTLIKQMFDVNNQMLALNPQHGKYLTATGIFRGRTLSLKLLHDYISEEKNSQRFIQWIPNNCKIAHCDIPPNEFSRSVTGIANHTGIVKQFDYILQPYTKLFQRRAFIHWFIDEGLEEIELIEGENKIKDLVKDYKQYENDE
ncbi:unnamed protein product [Rotaria magnacalcarata]|uniref:Tubulin beta chain n=6 Tax=Rotaria magnacalcarata TaxID=392030 RepID=A0A815YFT7_9BILA|nr:unnamed protein product [Rotaria magnacalcarata]CAF1655113.1 unnamed protein product [Rotaria magnacalcarata]CAF2014483.1 unnamed protein product [Rotaria magnacalcarata]CAF2072306.1 unnamed protein product [Rotaria magnacalcarata]CAF3770994.1 unnamed protein product [Rotaria magnacalcarata]